MTASVIIVGAGVIGLLAARQLARAGWQVTLLDAGADCPSASWAAGGILSPLCPWRAEVAVGRLADTSVERYLRLARELVAEGCVDPEVDACGLLATTETDVVLARGWADRQGRRLDIVPAGEVQAGLGNTEALWVPELGAVNNARLLKSLRQSLARLGVTRQQACVRAITPVSAGWRVVADSGQWQAEQVLVAAGAWTAPLLVPLGIQLPIRLVKGQIALFRFPQRRLGPVVIGDRSYLVPRRDGSVLVGSTLEENPVHMRPDRQGAELLEAKWRALWPLLGGAEVVAHWAGFRPGNRSDVPFIGAVPGRDGLFVCAGHYRDGICAAPASVELLVAQMCDKPLPFDATDYALPSSSASPSLSA